MFTPKYAGNLTLAAVFFVAIVIIQLVQGAATALPSGVDNLLTLLAILSAVGIVYFGSVAAVRGQPAIDWSDETGQRLHPGVKAGLRTLGVVGVGLGGIAFYIAIYLFQWPLIIVPMVLLAVIGLAVIVYLTAGKHVST
ncbi:hypothetical protein [Caenispirillum bisanense]|uniref:hypothetical protein n=1 Tax=Caenispirillum bisanense TaxID=414052 RepID=UPI0031DB2E25